jgi:hypothetical protein
VDIQRLVNRSTGCGTRRCVRQTKTTSPVIEPLRPLISYCFIPYNIQIYSDHINRTPNSPSKVYMADTSQNGSESNVASQRPRLNLKPRDPEAAARLEAERQSAFSKVR